MTRRRREIDDESSNSTRQRVQNRIFSFLSTFPRFARMSSSRSANLSVSIPTTSASPLESPAMSSVLQGGSSDSLPITPPCTVTSNPFLPPAGLGPRGMMRRNSSLSSCSSAGESEDEHEQLEWNAEEMESLRTVSHALSVPLAIQFSHFLAHFQTTEQYISHAKDTMSPFTGAPPSNLTHVIARAVVSANSASRVGRRKKLGTLDTAPTAWRHGLKSTRLMILALVKERDGSADTPKQFDPETTPKRRSVRIVRQGSMDFLPVTQRNVSAAARLGSRLQGPPPVTNQTAHPYSRMQRTASLSCIPGSPTQPKKKEHTSASTSTRMSRVSSDGQGMLNPIRFRALDAGAAPLETLSGSPSTGGYASGSSNTSLLSSWSANVVPSNSSLSSAFTSTPPKARGAGLASAFHSPLLGPTAPTGLVYPTPISVKRSQMISISDSGAKSAGPLEGSFQEQLERGLAQADRRLEVPGSAREATFGSRLEVPSAKGGFYFGGAREEDSMSPYEYDSDASHASSRSNSPYPAMSMSNSPMSSSFDLNDLSLDALAKEKMASNGAGFFDAWAAGWQGGQQ